LKLLLGASAAAMLESRFAAGEAWLEKDAGVAPAFQPLRLGEIKPAGWIKAQMARDLEKGFAGNLDELCHEASSDIFCAGRNSPASEGKKTWWNGETEGNWRTGHLAMAYLAEDATAMRKADAYVQRVLSFQDADGYIGISSPELRYKKPGELWTQACLFRGLLDYADLTGDEAVHTAVVRACARSMAQFGPARAPLAPGVGGGGESHDLMFVDVMETLYARTGEAQYRDFAVELYRELSLNVPKADTAMGPLLDLQSGFSEHGVNTYETIRVPLFLWMATGRKDFGQAARNALVKMARYTEVSGSGVGDENISLQTPDPTTTQYEYCSTKEIQCTLQSAMQKLGSAALGDRIEHIWFNAAQASRLADGTGISYLSSDNRLHCDGLPPKGGKPDASNKMSPTHADVAVCCNPNATIIGPMYVRDMWMRPAGGGLAAMLYGPCVVSTRVNDVAVRLDQRTQYPFGPVVEIDLHPERAVAFPLRLRNPLWSAGTTVACAGANITREGDFWVVTKTWRDGDSLKLTFTPVIREVPAADGEVALAYGALLFAEPIEAIRVSVKTYPVQGFEDTYYVPAPGSFEELELKAGLRADAFGFKHVVETGVSDPLRPFDTPSSTLQGMMTRKATGIGKAVTLVPMGCAPTLRRLTFSIA
jgi:DUF1680 family protein